MSSPPIDCKQSLGALQMPKRDDEGEIAVVEPAAPAQVVLPAGGSAQTDSSPAQTPGSIIGSEIVDKQAPVAGDRNESAAQCGSEWTPCKRVTTSLVLPLVRAPSHA